MTFGIPANLSECQTLLLHRILKHQIQLPTFNMFVGINTIHLPRLLLTKMRQGRGHRRRVSAHRGFVDHI